MVLDNQEFRAETFRARCDWLGRRPAVSAAAALPLERYNAADFDRAVRHRVDDLDSRRRRHAPDAAPTEEREKKTGQKKTHRLKVRAIEIAVNGAGEGAAPTCAA
jgi:hypothetical protein